MLVKYRQLMSGRNVEPAKKKQRLYTLLTHRRLRVAADFRSVAREFREINNRWKIFIGGALRMERQIAAILIIDVRCARAKQFNVSVITVEIRLPTAPRIAITAQLMHSIHNRSVGRNSVW